MAVKKHQVKLVATTCNICQEQSSRIYFTKIETKKCKLFPHLSREVVELSMSTVNCKKVIHSQQQALPTPIISQTNRNENEPFYTL
jgi:hypothetical protein